MTDVARTPQERYDHGRSLRDEKPLEDHAEWSAAPGRPDPVGLIEEQNETRVPWLVPVRRHRMAASAFAFYRGTARVMAYDLADSPVSGIHVQICGDAHLANFGAYASPERQLVFDLNDFDETLPGPWEWDVKRLAASFVLAGRHNGLGKKDTRHLTRRAVRTYREAMGRLSKMGVTDIWYRKLDMQKLVGSLESRKHELKVGQKIEKAKAKDSRHALRKLAEEVDGEYRIRSEPPLLIPLRDLSDAGPRDEVEDATLRTFERYVESVPDDVAYLLRQFRPVDFAVKVVGVGSVGTRCYIMLLEGRDREDPLFLQIKEARPSVLEEHLPPSRYETAGERVVKGQRLMQTVSDIFLGHVVGAVTGHQFYWRQLRDWKLSAEVESTSASALNVFAVNRGWTLARAHARSGDPIAIHGYLDDGRTFDRAVTRFAEQYANQCEQDFAAFAAEISSGRLESAPL